MTEVSLEVLNRRAAVDAVRAEAARIGADSDALLDSHDFYGRVTSLNPDAPGYSTKVRELVAAAVPAAVVGQGGDTQQPPPAGPRQWTLEDVEKSTPAETFNAINEGLLRDLGVGPRRKRR
jgi:hypothetical protein